METLTYAEYHHMAQGFQRRATAAARAEDAAWERVRWQTWQLINIQLPVEDRLSGPEELLQLRTDRPRVAAPSAPSETPEEMIARLRKLDPDKFK